MKVAKLLFYLQFTVCVSVLTDLYGQHQIITVNQDTLNCSQIEFDLEMEEVVCKLFSTDSVLVFNPDDIVSIKYHYYPKYPYLTQPQLIIRAGIGIAISNYTQAFNNISTQNVLEEELKRGTSFTIGVQYHNRHTLGVAGEYGRMWYKQDKDSSWAVENFNIFGMGISYCGQSITNELFTTAQLLFTYSEYKTKGKIPSNSEEFYGDNQLFGAVISGTLNYHISENLILGFSGKLHFFDKKPSTPSRISITLGVFEIGMGFSWLFSSNRAQNPTFSSEDKF